MIESPRTKMFYVEILCSSELVHRVFQGSHVGNGDYSCMANMQILKGKGTFKPQREHGVFKAKGAHLGKSLILRSTLIFLYIFFSL